MTLHRITLLVLLVFPTCLLSQESIRLVLTDQESASPISNAHITPLDMPGAAVVTDAAGNATIYVGARKCIRISHIQYGDTTLCIPDATVSSWNVKLKARQFILPEVSIDSAPDTVYGHHEFHVADYAFLPEGLLLLTYHNEKLFKRQEETGKSIFEGCRLVWLNHEGDLLASTQIGHECSGFHLRYPGKAILRTRFGFQWISLNDDQIVLSDLSKEEFKTYIAPVQDSVKTTYIAYNWSSSFPAFDYFHFNQGDSVAQLMLTIEDEFLMELFRAEYKWLPTRAKLEAHRAEISTGIDKEIIGGYMSGFANSFYFKPLYAPVFASFDRIYVFNHYNDQLYFFNENASVTDSVEINYHKGKEGRFWSEELVYDVAQDRCYAVFDRFGKTWLREIDFLTGELREIIELTYHYPDHISVRDGEVYYIYRPFESSQSRYLYKELLPAR